MLRVKRRVTLTVDPCIASYLHTCAQRTGSNISAYVEAHFAAQALRESIGSHASWFTEHSSYLDDAEIERSFDVA
jgi:hypothetical protein